MSKIKIKTFNNFLDSRNVVKDGEKTTPEIEIEAFTLKSETLDPSNMKPSIDIDKVIKMVECRTPDTGLIRELLLSLTADLPELVSRVLTSSEATKVYELISAVTFEDDPYDNERMERTTDDKPIIELISEKIHENLEPLPSFKPGEPFSTMDTVSVSAGFHIEPDDQTNRRSSELEHQKSSSTTTKGKIHRLTEDCFRFQVPETSIEKVSADQLNRSSNINPVLGADFESLIISRNGIQRSSFVPRSSSVIISTNNKNSVEIFKSNSSSTDSVIVPRITETASLAVNSLDEISVILEKVGSRSADLSMNPTELVRRYIQPDPSCGLATIRRSNETIGFQGVGIPRDQLINSSRTSDNSNRTLDLSSYRTRETDFISDRTLEHSYGNSSRATIPLAHSDRTIDHDSGNQRHQSSSFHRINDSNKIRSFSISDRTIGQCSMKAQGSSSNITIHHPRPSSDDSNWKLDPCSSRDLNNGSNDKFDNPWGLPSEWAKHESDLRRGIQE